VDFFKEDGVDVFKGDNTGDVDIFEGDNTGDVNIFGDNIGGVDIFGDNVGDVLKGDKGDVSFFWRVNLGDTFEGKEFFL
jgi:hypothetical protein